MRLLVLLVLLLPATSVGDKQLFESTQVEAKQGELMSGEAGRPVTVVLACFPVVVTPAVI
jgi:hypothetical protein